MVVHFCLIMEWGITASPSHTQYHHHLRCVRFMGMWAFNQCTGEWFQISWPTTRKDIDITVKELLPITIAAAIWGNQWKGQRILFLSDNAAVVAALKARSACHVTLSHLIKCLFFWEATFDFEHNSEHIAGSLNTTADALSRNRLDLFFSLNQ